MDANRTQPLPVNASICRFERDGRVMTAIARTWRIADARACTLCPGNCAAMVAADGSHALCLKVFQRDVPDAEAALVQDVSGVCRPGRDDAELVRAAQLRRLTPEEALERLRTDPAAGRADVGPQKPACCESGCRWIDRIRRLLGLA